MTFEFRGDLEDDGLYTPVIKRHSLEKIRLHNYYVSMFTTSMRKRWPQLAYVGLYSGAGRARIHETGEIIETTAMSAFRPQYPFTKYIFVDNDPRCTAALRDRITALPEQFDYDIIEQDVSDAAPAIIQAMPEYGPGNGLLSFCFVDPFSAQLEFHVLNDLGNRFKMDFLVLLMLGQDVRMNFRQYFEDPEDTRIAALIDDPYWRREWTERGLRRKDLLRYLLEKFDSAMTRLGYRAAPPEDAHPIRVMGKRVFLYYLVLYSKDELGQRFWESTRKGTDSQLGLGL